MMGCCSLLPPTTRYPSCYLLARSSSVLPDSSSGMSFFFTWSKASLTLQVIAMVWLFIECAHHMRCCGVVTKWWIPLPSCRFFVGCWFLSLRFSGDLYYILLPQSWHFGYITWCNTAEDDFIRDDPGRRATAFTILLTFTFLSSSSVGNNSSISSHWSVTERSNLLCSESNY